MDEVTHHPARTDAANDHHDGQCAQDIHCFEGYRIGGNHLAVEFHPAIMVLAEDQKNARDGADDPSYGVDHDPLQGENLFQSPAGKPHGVEHFHILSFV